MDLFNQPHVYFSLGRKRLTDEEIQQLKEESNDQASGGTGIRHSFTSEIIINKCLKKKNKILTSEFIKSQRSKGDKSKLITHSHSYSSSHLGDKATE